MNKLSKGDIVFITNESALHFGKFGKISAIEYGNDINGNNIIWYYVIFEDKKERCFHDKEFQVILKGLS